MADPASLYPPAPAGVPANLARPGLRYRVQVVGVLLTLILFVVFHVTLLACAVALMVSALWLLCTGAATAQASWQSRLFLIVLPLSLLALGAMLFAFLVKGLFKQSSDETSQYVEVTKDSQPELFYFIRLLCQEIDCAVPAHVYLSHE